MPTPTLQDPVSLPDTSMHEFPFGNLVRYLAFWDAEGLIINNYIQASMASGDGGFIKEGAGAALKFTCDEAALGELQDRNYNARLGAMSRLFREGVYVVSEVGVTYQHVRDFILQSGETAIPITASANVQSSGVPCVTWITYTDRSAFYDNMGVLHGKVSESYVLEHDNSDETDPLFVAAHIAMGLCQLEMRDAQLIAERHKSFTVWRCANSPRRTY